MSNNVVDVLKGVVGELKEIATSEAVIGKAITVGNQTVIPVVKISVGFGAGGGQGEKSTEGQGFGGGGGGGAKIQPIAFIILDPDGPKLLPVSKHKWEGMIDAIPGLAKKMKKWMEEFKTEEDDDGHSEKKHEKESDE